MGEKELRLQASELTRLVVLCQCGTEIVFTPTQASGELPDFIQCPNCRATIAGARQLVTTYREFAALVAMDPARVQFLAKLPQ